MPQNPAVPESMLSSAEERFMGYTQRAEPPNFLETIMANLGMTSPIVPPRAAPSQMQMQGMELDASQQGDTELLELLRQTMAHEQQMRGGQSAAPPQQTGQSQMPARPQAAPGFGGANPFAIIEEQALRGRR